MDADTQDADHPRCPWCEYDLFGLPADGNIVRCPECGNRSDLRLLRIDASDRAKKVRGMESLPAACAILFPFALLFGLECLAMRLLPSPCAAPLLLLAILWGICVLAYILRYRYVVGAVRALVLFHVCPPLMLAGLPTAIIGACTAGTVAGRSLRDPAIAIGFALLGIVMVLTGAWFYRRARGILRHMHDQLTGRTRQRDA